MAPVHPLRRPRGTAPTLWPDQNGFLNDPDDSTDGLTQIGAREYDPTTGQFISLDPQLDSTDPESLNGYTYTYSDPVTDNDSPACAQWTGAVSEWSTTAG